MQAGFKSTLILTLPNQINFILNEVKITFFEFPFKIEAVSQYKDYFAMPDLLTLAAMKTFALAGRGKWKDYVDLYFILKDHYSVKEIFGKAKAFFHDVFNLALFKK